MLGRLPDHPTQHEGRGHEGHLPRDGVGVVQVGVLAVEGREKLHYKSPL